MIKEIESLTRKGIKDTGQNAFMVRGAEFSVNDIPFCPTTADAVPSEIVVYSEAVEIYNREKKKNNTFAHPAYVCFYEDDHKFDSRTSGVWNRPDIAHGVLKHFAGIITPDFSTYQDYPEPLKTWNTYRMRAFGYWRGVICGQSVINNVRWGTPESYRYCFDGIPRNSIVAIGTVGGSPRKLADRPRFEEGIEEMSKTLSPHTIIVCGSANYDCFKRLEDQGVRVVSYPSKTSKAYAMRKIRRPE